MNHNTIFSIPSPPCETGMSLLSYLSRKQKTCTLVEMMRWENTHFGEEYSSCPDKWQRVFAGETLTTLPSVAESLCRRLGFSRSNQDVRTDRFIGK